MEDTGRSLVDIEKSRNGGRGLRQWDVVLITAEAKIVITTFPRGPRKAVLIFEFYPAAFSGDTAGISFEAAMMAGSAEAFAQGLVHGPHSIQRMIEEGRGVVPGKEYARVNLDMTGSGRLFVFLTANDCHTLAKAIMEAVEYARKTTLV